tara:strand:+ start:105 stop:518 length:414 start_codon:yes stop_codon:yes gene_type:complete
MNTKPDFSFWSNQMKPFKEEMDMSYTKAIKSHEKDKWQKLKKQDKENEHFVANILEDKIVVKPVHYEKFAIEPITFIMKNGLEFWRGNIVKYAVRCGHKTYDGMDEVESEITDLKKVIRYAEMRINQLEGKEPNAIS